MRQDMIPNGDKQASSACMACRHEMQVKVCGMQELDPNGKFRSLSDVWAWRATRRGLDVPLAMCCGPDGFSAECACAPRLDCTVQAASGPLLG